MNGYSGQSVSGHCAHARRAAKVLLLYGIFVAAAGCGPPGPGSDTGDAGPDVNGEAPVALSGCALAEQNDGARGCRFYGVQVDNIDSEDDRALMLILSNQGSANINASIEVRDVSGAWQMLTAAVVPAEGGTRIELRRPIREAGSVPGGAYRVETDGPVLAVQIVGNDDDRGARSTAGTVLRPRQALGTSYLVVTGPAEGSPEVDRTPGSRGGAGAVAVVATSDATVVHLSLTVPAVVGPGIVLDPPPPFYDVMLDEGDVLQLFSASAGGDLTGSRIETSAPVAAFSGNVFTTYGRTLSGSNGGDLAMEQLVPTRSWSNEYIGARFSAQGGCDTFFGTGAGLWRVIASENNTNVTLSPAPGVIIDGPDLPGLQFVLQGGGFQSFFVRGDRNSGGMGDFFVHASLPVLLAQWLDCEPGLSWGIDARMPGGRLAFTLPSGFDHEILIVRQSGSAVSLDGKPISESRWTTVYDKAGGWDVVRIGSADLGRCVDAWDSCSHVLSGPVFNVAWRGMDLVCSYSLTVPPWNGCAAPNASCPN